MGVRYIHAINNNEIPCVMSRRKTPSDAMSHAQPSANNSCGIRMTGSQRPVSSRRCRMMIVAISNATVANS